MWPHVYVICVCLVFLSPSDLLVLEHNVTKQTQRTQISGKDSNGTKHGRDPLKMVVKKDRNMLGFYTYKHVFNISLVLNVKVSVF
jgi:hypothetical protein